jgi:hypothetical protein
MGDGAARTSRGQRRPRTGNRGGTPRTTPEPSYLHGEVDVVLDTREVLLDGSVDLLQLPLDLLRHDLLSHRATPPDSFAACRRRNGAETTGQGEQ